MIFDPRNAQGARALARLNDEELAWLTTSFPDGRLAPSLVWFLWIDEELIVYSRDNAKVRNIEANSNVGFNLNSDDRGGGVLTITGLARVDRSYPASDQVAEYSAKYAARIARNSWTPASFAADYSVPIRITPTSFRAW